MALSLLFYADQEFTVSEPSKSNALISSNSDGFLANITESEPSAVITTNEAPSPRKGPVPTFLSIKAKKKIVYRGEAVRDSDDKILAPIAYGYSQLFEYTVLDQKRRPMRRTGMKARENVVYVTGNIGISQNISGATVTVNEEGRFSDLQSLYTDKYPPLPAGSFIKFKQMVTVSYKDEDFLLGVVCIEQRAEEVVLTAYSRTDVTCK